MKKILAILFIILLILPGVGAAADPIDAGKKMITEGIKDFFIEVADAIFDLGFQISEDDLDLKDEYGYTVNAVFLIATHEYNPLHNEAVREMQFKSILMSLFILTIYILFGGCLVNLSTIFPNQAKAINYIMHNETKSPIVSYSETLVKVFFIVMFAYAFISVSIMLNTVLTKLAMFNVLDSIKPTPENFIMYFMMSICYLALAMFFAMRIIIISVYSACVLLISGLYAFKVTRDFSISLTIYYLKVVFMQFLIVLVTSLGIKVIESVSFVVNAPVLYLSLIVILFLICLSIMVGLTKIFNASKIVLKGRKLIV